MKEGAVSVAAALLLFAHWGQTPFPPPPAPPAAKGGPVPDDRRDFLKMLTALGGAAAFPEMAQTMQASEMKVKLTPPVNATIVKHEESKTDETLDVSVELQIIGANNVKQYVTASSFKTETPTIRRTTTVMKTDMYANASDEKPAESNTITVQSTAKKIDPEHEEISNTMFASGGVFKGGPKLTRKAATLPTAGMSDEELIKTLLLPRMGGGAQ